jgi:hypothetical protein
MCNQWKPAVGTLRLLVTMQKEYNGESCITKRNIIEAIRFVYTQIYFCCFSHVETGVPRPNAEDGRTKV